MSASPPDPTLPARAHARETADSGRNATGLALVWARLEAAEEAMATMGAGLSVTQKLMERFAITRRQARALQAAVRMRWQQEARVEPREQRLERYRRTLEQVVKQGFDRKVTVLVDAKSGEYEVVPQPDLKAVTAATALLIRMDGGDGEREPPPPPPSNERPAITVGADQLSAELAARNQENE